MDSKNPWGILILLALIGAISMFAADNFITVCILMGLAYLNNTSYSVVSRSGVRNSALYHGLAVLASNFLFYSVLHQLNANNLTLALFVPYTVATVYGSFTGVNLSMKIEERFGITTDTKAKPSKESALAKKILLVLLLALMVWFAVSGSGNIKAALTIAGLMFLDDMTFSLLRRSRNSNNVMYHIIISILKSAVWYLLYRNLSMSGMAFVLFPAYCFGSVLGNIFGQELSARIETMIGASADAHLSSSSSNFIPWKGILILGFIGGIFLIVADKPGFVLILTALAIGQQISFSIVSRSRQRNNMTYHIIAAIFSNGVWFLTFRQLFKGNWTPDLYVPYAAGSALGSITGVGISMGIEKKLNIASDTKPAPKPA